MSDSEMGLSEMRELIDKSVRELGFWRGEKVRAKTELETMLEQLKKSERWQTHETILAEANDRVNELVAGIHKLGIDYFKRTGVKTSHQAVKVQVRTRLEYDQTKAKQWAIENLPVALKLDTKLFEKHAKGVRDTQALTFVTFKEEAQTTISQNLSEHDTDESDVEG